MGIIITTTESEDVLTEGFKTWLDLLPDRPFYGESHPFVVITDDCKAEKAAVANVFPNTTQLLCIFHILQVLFYNQTSFYFMIC